MSRHVASQLIAEPTVGMVVFCIVLHCIAICAIFTAIKKKKVNQAVQMSTHNHDYVSSESSLNRCALIKLKEAKKNKHVE